MKQQLIYWMPYIPLFGIVGMFAMQDRDVSEVCIYDDRHFIASSILQGLSIPYLLISLG